MSFGLDTFKQSQLGLKVGELLNDPQTVSDMIAVSKHTERTPAVQVLGKAIMNFGLPITNADKIAIGRWVREVMEDRGWTTDANSKARVSAGNLFTTGAFYYPQQP